MVTRGYSAKIRVLFCRSRAYGLPITGSDAPPLRYRRLVRRNCVETSPWLCLNNCDEPVITALFVDKITVDFSNKTHFSILLSRVAFNVACLGSDTRTFRVAG